MRTVACEENHGRLPWMGHVQCDACGRWHRHQPKTCVCGCVIFKAGCAKCFATEQRSFAAASSFDMRGELPVPGRGVPLE